MVITVLTQIYLFGFDQSDTIGQFNIKLLVRKFVFGNKKNLKKY